MINEFIHEPRIAYFSMEIALRNEIPTYSGGLGVLAGDTVRTAADLELPMVAVTLVSKEGYFRQVLQGGQQIEKPDPWDPAMWASPLNAIVAVDIGGRQVWIKGWLYILQGHMNGRQPVILLDTDLNENYEEDRLITQHLYGGDDTYRLKQEIVLGIGGVRMLQALGFNLMHFHMNEGHSALLSLELLHRYRYSLDDVRPGESPYDVPRVREMCGFTTHTPVESGHDRFDYGLIKELLDEFVDLNIIKQHAGSDRLNMTRLALNLSEFVNGVAKRHAEVSRKMFPGYNVHAITNGVHPYFWTHPNFSKLYDNHLPGWCHETQLLRRAEYAISDDLVWEAHCKSKVALINQLKILTDKQFDENKPIFGFARRMTAYKRPDLLFSDLDRLKKLAAKYPFQIVMAGKAHPKDTEGKRLIERLHEFIQQLSGNITMAFIPNYDLATALSMVSGVDVWLNTPLKPLEASGTSGMKAAFNGVPSLSVLDGWWIEGCIEGVTGWAIGDDQSDNGNDARSLYDKLEQNVLPLWYEDRPGWIKVMKGAITINASFFNSHRMMRRYVAESYIR